MVAKTPARRRLPDTSDTRTCTLGYKRYKNVHLNPHYGMPSYLAALPNLDSIHIIASDDVTVHCILTEAVEHCKSLRHISLHVDGIIKLNLEHQTRLWSMLPPSSLSLCAAEVLGLHKSLGSVCTVMAHALRCLSLGHGSKVKEEAATWHALSVLASLESLNLKLSGESRRVGPVGNLPRPLPKLRVARIRKVTGTAPMRWLPAATRRT